MNAIFRSGDVVLRVGHVSATPEASCELAHVLADHGVRVPTPQPFEPVVEDDLAVTGWELLAVADVPTDWEEVGAMVARLHRLEQRSLPAGYPLADPRAFAWWKFDALLAELGPHLDEAARQGLTAAAERCAQWRDFDVGPSVVCHGDVHPGNVLMTEKGAVLLDWDLLSLAPRGWDHGPLMTWEERWGGEAFYEPFAAGYGWSGRGDIFAEAVAELRLVAATLMRVRAALAEPTAWPEAELRLRYWRGTTDAPRWSAQ